MVSFQTVDLKKESCSTHLVALLFTFDKGAISNAWHLVKPCNRWWLIDVLFEKELSFKSCFLCFHKISPPSCFLLVRQLPVIHFEEGGQVVRVLFLMLILVLHLALLVSLYTSGVDLISRNRAKSNILKSFSVPGETKNRWVVVC